MAKQLGDQNNSHPRNEGMRDMKDHNQVSRGTSQHEVDVWVRDCTAVELFQGLGIGMKKKGKLKVQLED